MAAKVHFSIEQGATLNKTIHRVRTTMGANVDMSAYTGSCVLKKNYAASNGYSIDASFSNTGEVIVQATANATSAIPQGRYVYDIIGTNEGTILRVTEGYVSVDPSVT